MLVLKCILQPKPLSSPELQTYVPRYLLGLDIFHRHHNPNMSKTGLSTPNLVPLSVFPPLLKGVSPCIQLVRHTLDYTPFSLPSWVLSFLLPKYWVPLLLSISTAILAQAIILSDLDLMQLHLHLILCFHSCFFPIWLHTAVRICTLGYATCLL